MIITYLAINNINFNRMCLAVTASIIIHIAIVLFFVYRNNNTVYIENNVIATSSSRINVSISKLSEQKKTATVPKIVKSISTENPVSINEASTTAKAETTIDEILENEHLLKDIPVVDNVTFKGTRVPPAYPKRALILKQEGVVILKALIDTKGSIKNVIILSSSGYTILDKSAIEAVWKWKFEPSVIDGKKSISWVKVPVEFIIK